MKGDGNAICSIALPNVILKKDFKKILSSFILVGTLITCSVYADDDNTIFDNTSVIKQTKAEKVIEDDPFTSEDESLMNNENIQKNKEVKNTNSNTKNDNEKTINNTIVNTSIKVDETKNEENKQNVLFKNVENSSVVAKLSMQSKEELKSLYDRGFRVFEITVTATRDNQVVLADNFGEYFKKYYGKSVYTPTIDEFFSYKMLGSNTQMSLGDINVFLDKYPDSRFFVKTLEQNKASLSIINHKSMKNKDKIILEDDNVLSEYKDLKNLAMVDLKGIDNIRSYISMNEAKKLIFLYKNTTPSYEEIETIKNTGNMIYEFKKVSNIDKTNGIIYSTDDVVNITLKKPKYVYPTTYVRPTIKSDRFIAHAGGRYAGINMSNTMQAMESSYNRGVRLIEIDFDWTTDGKIVQLHDWASFRKLTTDSYSYDESLYMNYEKFKTRNMIYKMKQMSIDETLDFLRTHKDAYIVTDVKQDNMKDANKVFLASFNEDGQDVKDRIIPQIYNTDEYKVVKDFGYKNIIYTLYRTEQSIYNVLEFAKLNDLYAITMDNYTRINTKLPKILMENGIRVYTHTENNKSRAKSFFINGKAYGIYSDIIMSDEELNK